MRAYSLLGLVLLALPFAAVPASAACEVTTLGQYPDINYTTICVLDEGTTFDDTTQRAEHDYLLHMSHAVEADPAFDYAYAGVERGTWTYDDGEVRHEREWVHVGSGAWEGVRGIAGGGYHANVDQRDQTAVEDGSGACSGVTGRSTCVGAGGWFTVQDVASVGVGFYSMQTGTAESCQDSYELDVDALIIFVPITTGPMSCAAQMPWLYDSEVWDAFAPLP